MIENFRIGIDIVEINKFQKLDFKSKKEFYKKIFSESEIKYCRKFKDSYRHFAGKFAVKEAVIKSIDKKLKLKDIQIKNINGIPKISIPKQYRYRFLVSLSHEKNYAIGVVISEKII